jgi:hypothetical protein
MEVEDEDALLQRLFFKRFGRALPEEKEKDDVDQIKFVIDLTDDTEEMEDDTNPPLVPIPVVKTEAPEAPEIADVNVANVADVVRQRRASRRLEIIELARARKAITEFGKSLRKKDIIPEKEAPLAASSNVIADNDSDMAEDNPVGSVNSVNTVEMAIKTTEAAIAESDAAIAASEAAIAASENNRREFTDEFGDTPIDEFDD